MDKDYKKLLEEYLNKSKSFEKDIDLVLDKKHTKIVRNVAKEVVIDKTNN